MKRQEAKKPANLRSRTSSYKKTAKVGAIKLNKKQPPKEKKKCGC